MLCFVAADPFQMEYAVQHVLLFVQAQAIVAKGDLLPDEMILEVIARC